MGKESARNARDTGNACLIPGQENPLEEDTAVHSSILAWRIPWTEETGKVIKSLKRLSMHAPLHIVLLTTLKLGLNTAHKEKNTRLLRQQITGCLRVRQKGKGTQEGAGIWEDDETILYLALGLVVQFSVLSKH